MLQRLFSSRDNYPHPVNTVRIMEDRGKKKKICSLASNAFFARLLCGDGKTITISILRICQPKKAKALSTEARKQILCKVFLFSRRWVGESKD